MKSAVAACGPCSTAFSTFSRVATTAGLRGDALGNAQGLVQHLGVRHHLLHKIQAQGLVGAKLVGGQQVQHRVAQACALGHAQRGAARGHDAALDFHLRKTAVLPRHHDVGAQHQLDAHREADAFDGRHHRLGAAAVAGQAEIVGLHLAVGHGLLAALHVRRDGGQVQPGGEVVAKRMQHAHAQARVVVQAGVGLGQLAEHGHRPAIALGGAVDADQQHVAAHFGVDAALGGHGVVCGAAHGRSNRAGIIGARLQEARGLARC